LNHSVTINESRKITDMHHGLLVTCCGDPATGSWITFPNAVLNDQVQCQQALDEHCQRVAANHQAALTAAATFPALIGTSFQIDVPDPTPAPTPTPSDPPADPTPATVTVQ
jgi:hypothetical protein